MSSKIVRIPSGIGEQTRIRNPNEAEAGAVKPSTATGPVGTVAPCGGRGAFDGGIDSAGTGYGPLGAAASRLAQSGSEQIPSGLAE